MRRFVFSVLLVSLLLIDARAAYADAFSLSGVINRRLRPDQIDSSGQLYETFALTGIMEISTTPTVLDLGDRYRVRYDIGFNFFFDDDSRISGAGAMIVDGNGCGLFDCNMAGYANSDTGHRFAWTVANGAFYRADGTEYPSVFEDARPYAVPPARFELSYWDSLVVGGPFETANRYFIPRIEATRVESVPEPAALAVLGLGIGILGRALRRKRP